MHESDIGFFAPEYQQILGKNDIHKKLLTFFYIFELGNLQLHFVLVIN